jgi:hypothetical protein
MRGVKELLAAIAGAIAAGALALFMFGNFFLGFVDMLVMTPLKWYNGDCSAEYVEEYKQQSWHWVPATCRMPSNTREETNTREEREDLQDELDDIQDKQAELQKRADEIKQRLDKLQKH